MRKTRYFAFDAFRLDPLDERLWKDESCVPLGRKAFAVLAQLISCPNQLVTKDDLLASVWRDTAVSEAVLTTAMREIRAAIGDTARTPRFVQTVHGRGYRFIAPVVETLETRSSPVATDSRLRSGTATPHIVGREAEWRRLHEWFGETQAGARRIGFIAGEAGIGKTALIDAFLGAIASTGAARILR